MSIIRRATFTDAEPIHTAHMRSIREVCARYYSHEEIQAWGFRPYREDKWHEAILNDHVWVVDSSGSVESYGHLRLKANGDKTALVLGLYLTNAMLGQELGKELLDHILREARSSGIRALALESTITAKTFCERMGFKETGPLSLIEINGHKIRCFPMARELT
jgi:N-acetylglutamate synthase-like GNAT family acetyltransferase